LFLSQTARLADVVLPVQSWMEREGSYTTGERRAQRYYPALRATTALPARTESPGTRRAPLLKALYPELQGPLADFAIPALIAERLEAGELAQGSAAAVFNRLAEFVPAFAGLSYQKLAQVREQWPIVGREDLYYGGTAYENTQGLGAPLSLVDGQAQLVWPRIADFRLPKLGLMAFPVTRLYDRGSTVMPSDLLHERIGEPYVVMNVHDAGRLNVEPGDMVRVNFSESGWTTAVAARLDGELPERVLLVPRSFGIPISGPTSVEVKRDA
jgi:NADH-quinone oxidoreductase subunit G